MDPSAPGERLELFLSARGLKRMDVLSESDPLCRVSFKDSFMSSFSDLGATEVLRNQANPNWATTFPFMYLFEVEQTLNFEVIDDDGHNGELIGKASTAVGAIYANRGTLILDLKHGNIVTGKLIVRSERLNVVKESVTLEIRGRKIEDIEWFSKSDPFLVVNRLREDGSLLKVHQTETISNNLNPMWQPWTMKVQTLCNGDARMPLILECWDDESDGNHRLIGKAESTLERLIAKQPLELVNPAKQHKSGYKNSGVLEITTCVISTEYDFLDYLQGGVQLNLMVAIDFTGSNGAPAQVSSLHHIDPSQPNAYERAIWSVGGILEAYDSTKTFPVWGFGGQPQGTGAVSHCFSLAQGEVIGIPGVISAYRTCLEGVKLSGPTLFEHIIISASQIARQSPPGSVYSVLLILTDGEIHDMRETKALIVDASGLPMSVIIVGIGNADFSNMEALDSDKGLLRDEAGRMARRDVVQFVPFRKYEGDARRLAQEVLAEVPKQLTQFMKENHIVPRVQETVPLSSIT